MSSMDNQFLIPELKNKIDRLVKERDELKERVSLAEVIMQSSLDEDCRYDHNRNCQNHSWFGLEGDDCPIMEYKKKYQGEESE